jgi:hypothetical protein
VEIVEQFVAGKVAGYCEDAVVVTGGHAAVIDGATDVTGRRGGLLAMTACRDALHKLPATVEAARAVAALTRELAGRLDPTLPAAERPSASVTVFSAARREVWQVGDVGFWHPGLPPEQPRKLIDEIAARFRAAFLAAEWAAGKTDDQDTARPVLRELIARQGALRNTVGPYAYAGVDGRPVPPELVVVHPVPADVTELVLASDGYPVIHPTLAGTESALSGLLAVDPWCVRQLLGTKGTMPGQASYDDRAYLRLSLRR